jgi:hypothetical protein
MAQLTFYKITEIYCVADDFGNEFSKKSKKRQIFRSDGKRRRNRSFAMSDAEIITSIPFASLPTAFSQIQDELIKSNYNKKQTVYT